MSAKPKPRMMRSSSLTKFMKMVPARAFGSSKTPSIVVNKPEQSELPQPNVVFKEGYLFKRGRNRSVEGYTSSVNAVRARVYCDYVIAQHYGSVGSLNLKGMC